VRRALETMGWEVREAVRSPLDFGPRSYIAFSRGSAVSLILDQIRLTSLEETPIEVFSAESEDEANEDVLADLRALLKKVGE
jgi:hypothetical protein